MGGEKQRIAIARMMLKNAPIIILDEATAFTDTENEDKIQKSIFELAKGKTLLVIAHRLSTIKNADNIVVLKDGGILAEGTQEEMLSTCPLYQNMWEAHTGAKNWSVSVEKKEVAQNVSNIKTYHKLVRRFEIKAVHRICIFCHADYGSSIYHWTFSVVWLFSAKQYRQYFKFHYNRTECT